MSDSTFAPLYVATDEQYDRAIEVVSDLAAMTKWLAENIATMPAGTMDAAVTGGVRIGTFDAADFHAVAAWLHADKPSGPLGHFTEEPLFHRCTRDFGTFSVYVYVSTATLAMTA